MVGEQDAGQECGGAGATAHAERNLVVEAEVQRLDGRPAWRERRVGVEDHVAFEVRAEVRVAAGGFDGQEGGSVRERRVGVEW